MHNIRHSNLKGLSLIQQQREIERRVERKGETRIIEGSKGVSFEVWRTGNATHIQILKNGLSKGTYGRLVYKGNPKQLQSDLTHSLTLTCQLDFTQAVPIVTNFLRELNKWIQETNMTPNTNHTYK